eukprot:8852166-Karenia_brevis.AAC.1
MEWDLKIWSHQKAFAKLFMPADATNFVYWHAIALLLSTCDFVPGSWEKLVKYQRRLREQHAMSKTSVKQLMSDVGDIYEALAALSCPKSPGTQRMHAYLVSVFCFCVDTCKELLALLGSLAQSLYLVLK